MPRRRVRFPSHTQERARRRQGGLCANCGVVLAGGEEAHHADGDRGFGELGNCVILCRECHYLAHDGRWGGTKVLDHSSFRFRNVGEYRRRFVRKPGIPRNSSQRHRSNDLLLRVLGIEQMGDDFAVRRFVLVVVAIVLPLVSASWTAGKEAGISPLNAIHLVKSPGLVVASTLLNSVILLLIAGWLGIWRRPLGDRKGTGSQIALVAFVCLGVAVFWEGQFLDGTGPTLVISTSVAVALTCQAVFFGLLRTFFWRCTPQSLGGENGVYYAAFAIASIQAAAFGLWTWCGALVLELALAKMLAIWRSTGAIVVGESLAVWGLWILLQL